MPVICTSVMSDHLATAPTTLRQCSGATRTSLVTCPAPAYINGLSLVAQALVAGFHARFAEFASTSGHVGFVVNNATLGQVFIPPILPHSSSLSSPIIQGLYNRPISGLGSTTPQEIKENLIPSRIGATSKLFQSTYTNCCRISSRILC
jgi:hypothetical protein